MKNESSVISALDKIRNFDELANALRQSDRPELVSLYSPDNIPHAHEHLETLLEEHPDDNILRLLWAHTQISLDILPLSFIASSVYEVLQKGDILSKAPRLSFLVVAPLAMQLGEHEEYRIGLLILGHIISSNPEGFFNDQSEASSLYKLVDYFIEKEQNLAIERKESKSYFEFMNSVSTLLTNIRMTDSTGVTPPGQDFKNGVSTIYEPSITEDYILGEPTDAFKNSELLLTQKKTHGTDQTHTTIPENTKPEKNNNRYIIVALSVLIIFITYHFRETLSSFTSSILPATIPIEDRLVLTMDTFSHTTPTISSLPPFYALSLNTSNSLEEIDKRLKNISSGNGTSRKSETSNSQSAEPDTAPYSGIDDIEPLINIPEDGEVIPEAQIPEAKPIPVFSGKPASSSSLPQKPEDLGSSDRKQDISGQQQTPPRQTVQKSPDTGHDRMASQGSESSSSNNTEIEKFSPPLVFETITATNVLSAPTLFSPSIVRLQAQSLVEVTARIGVWLEIRSNAGQTGYILSQDARQSNRPNRR